MHIKKFKLGDIIYRKEDGMEDELMEFRGIRGGLIHLIDLARVNDPSKTCKVSIPYDDYKKGWRKSEAISSDPSHISNFKVGDIITRGEAIWGLGSIFELIDFDPDEDAITLKKEDEYEGTIFGNIWHTGWELVEENKSKIDNGMNINSFKKGDLIMRTVGTDQGFNLTVGEKFMYMGMKDGRIILDAMDGLQALKKMPYKYFRDGWTYWKDSMSIDDFSMGDLMRTPQYRNHEHRYWGKVQTLGENDSKIDNDSNKRSTTRVIIESPYKGDITRNIEYARRCVKDSLNRGESPIASHLLYTQEGILDDSNPEERKMGIERGLDWLEVADKQVFYIDYDISEGMRAAMDKANKDGRDWETRTIGKNPEKNLDNDSDILSTPWGKIRKKIKGDLAKKAAEHFNQRFSHPNESLPKPTFEEVSKRLKETTDSISTSKRDDNPSDAYDTLFYSLTFPSHLGSHILSHTFPCKFEPVINEKENENNKEKEKSKVPPCSGHDSEPGDDDGICNEWETFVEQFIKSYPKMMFSSIKFPNNV